MRINSATILQLPKIEDTRGNLTFLENNNQIPFEILRTYWIYDVPGGQDRDGHAFINQEEFIIAITGSLDVTINDGKNIVTHSLNRSYYGLYIPKGIWRQMKNFSTNALALVLSSTFYDESDYIRDYHQFLKSQTNELQGF